MAMYNKSNPNLFKARTNEWDSNQWQGKSKRQVDTSRKILNWTIATMVVLITTWFVVSVFCAFVN